MKTNPFFLGRLIAIGGNEDKVNELVILKRVVREVGKPDYKVGVITTASEEPEQRGQDYGQVFTTLGTSEIKILTIKTRAQANDSSIAKGVEDLDLIFLNIIGIAFRPFQMGEKNRCLSHGHGANGFETAGFFS